MPNGESSTSREVAAASAAAHHQATDAPSNNQVAQDDDDGYGIEYKMVMDLLMQVMSNADSETVSKIKKRVVEAFIRVDTSDDPPAANDITTTQQKKDSKGKGVSRQNNGGDEMEWEAA